MQKIVTVLPATICPVTMETDTANRHDGQMNRAAEEQ